MQRILIVEDDVTISGGIRLYLQGKGFAADCAGTIARAETLLAGSSYHNRTAQMIQLCSAFFLKKCRKCVAFSVLSSKNSLLGSVFPAGCLRF